MKNKSHLLGLRKAMPPLKPSAESILEAISPVGTAKMKASAISSIAQSHMLPEPAVRARYNAKEKKAQTKKSIQNPPIMQFFRQFPKKKIASKRFKIHPFFHWGFLAGKAWESFYLFPTQHIEYGKQERHRTGFAHRNNQRSQHLP
jgi:hypothetical protein